MRPYPYGLQALVFGAAGVLDLGGILTISYLHWSRGEHAPFPLALPTVGVAALIIALCSAWQWWRERARRTAGGDC